MYKTYFLNHPSLSKSVQIVFQMVNLPWKIFFKNGLKYWVCTDSKVFFHCHPAKLYVLYIWLNKDNYGWPLTQYNTSFSLISTTLRSMVMSQTLPPPPLPPPTTTTPGPHPSIPPIVLLSSVTLFARKKKQLYKFLYVKKVILKY